MHTTAPFCLGRTWSSPNRRRSRPRTRPCHNVKHLVGINISCRYSIYIYTMYIITYIQCMYICLYVYISTYRY